MPSSENDQLPKNPMIVRFSDAPAYSTSISERVRFPFCGRRGAINGTTGRWARYRHLARSRVRPALAGVCAINCTMTLPLE